MKAVTCRVGYNCSALGRCSLESGEAAAMLSKMVVPSRRCATESESWTALRAKVRPQDYTAGAEILTEQAGTMTVYCNIN